MIKYTYIISHNKNCIAHDELTQTEFMAELSVSLQYTIKYFCVTFQLFLKFTQKHFFDKF